MHSPEEHSVARLSGEAPGRQILKHKNKKPPIPQNTQNNLFCLCFWKSTDIIVILSFIFISSEGIDSEKNDFCQQLHQLVTETTCFT
jgi:hypothetical protein